MDLTARLLRAAARRPHVLLVPVPGGATARLAAEAEIARRGWPLATTPADADVLAAAGVPGPALSAVVDAVWAQVPAPRARIVLRNPAHIVSQLDRAAHDLADSVAQRADAPAGGLSEEAAAGAGHGGHEDHGGHDDHAGHGGHHGHHGGGMPLPGGFAMADLGEDRDGLMLDRLHVTLGPMLPDWPAGLVVRVTLQGDVIQEASAEVLDPVGGPNRAEEPLPAAVVELDGLARFLGVAGWAHATARCRAARDRLLVDPDDRSAVRAGLTLLAQVQRSRALRWSLRGIGAGGTDVTELLGQRLTRTRAALDGAPAGAVGAAPDLGGLAGALVGAELAAARLIVAAVDPLTERATAGEVTGG